MKQVPFPTTIYREDLIDIDLDNNGSLHRSFLNHAIGKFDDMANRFGVRLFRSGQPVNVQQCTCSGIFMAPNGVNLGIAGSDVMGTRYPNEIWIQLPEECYEVEGQFTLAVKVTNESAGVISTMRIIDGTVDNTGEPDAEVSTARLPTTTEILNAYAAWQAAAIGSVRFDINQTGIIDATGAAQARSNIDGQQDIGLYIDSGGYICQRISSDT